MNDSPNLKLTLLELVSQLDVRENDASLSHEQLTSIATQLRTLIEDWSHQFQDAQEEVTNLKAIIQAVRQRDAGKKCLCRGMG